MKFLFSVSLLAFFLIPTSSFAQAITYPKLSRYEPQRNEEIPNNNSGTGPSGTVSGINNILNNFNNPAPGKGIPLPGDSADWGLKNLRLDAGLTLTSFDDSSSTVNSSGHFRDYNLTLSGDLTDKDTIAIGFSNTRYETGGVNGILARTYGINFSWIHNLTDNYGIGLFGFVNDVDIEEINGNSYSYGYGALFTTFHEFEFCNISTASALAHTDYDMGHDPLFMSSLTFSKAFTDKVTGYVTFSLTESFKKDPDTDGSYGSWEVGAVYQHNDKLSFSIGFQRTEFLHNYNDNTLLLNMGYLF